MLNDATRKSHKHSFITKKHSSSEELDIRNLPVLC